MSIEEGWRDVFPKLGLNQRYVGDGIPLCYDLPDKHFLKNGATYVLLGSFDSPKFHSEPQDWAGSPYISRFSLPTNSPLYNKLCNKSGEKCQYKSKVVLDQDLACEGIECDVETLRIFQVEPGVYYEYLRMPCAYHSYCHSRRKRRKSLPRPGPPETSLFKSCTSSIPATT